MIYPHKSDLLSEIGLENSGDRKHIIEPVQEGSYRPKMRLAASVIVTGSLQPYLQIVIVQCFCKKPFCVYCLKHNTHSFECAFFP